MSFSLENSLVSGKMRQELYLKHLREVEKINNREANSVRKKLKEYQSITQLHKRNKINAKKFHVSEEKRKIQQQNKSIYQKIMSIQSDQDIKKSTMMYRYWQGGKDSTKTQLHHQYRKRQQERITQANARLMKAIMHQKSTILPQIHRKSDRFHRSRESLNESDIA